MEVTLKEAKAVEGLRFMAGEYPDPVRTVSVGARIAELIANPTSGDAHKTSVEFCGGTHLYKSGDIGPFTIITEEAVSKGTRRIVAVTGLAAANAIASGEDLKTRSEALAKVAEGMPYADAKSQCVQLSQELDSRKSELPALAKVVIRDTLNSLRKKLDKIQVEIKKKKKASALAHIKGVAASFDGQVFIERLDLGSDAKATNEAIKTFQKVKKSCSVMFVTVDEEAKKVLVICSVSKEHQSAGLKAGEWIKPIVDILGARGGGKDASAQCSGPNINKVDDVLGKAKELVAAAGL